ncbi:superoxide dismutase family protein [Sulfitobacter sp. LCG007]
MKTLALAAISAIALGSALHASEASSSITGQDGTDFGMVTAADTASGMVLVTLDLQGLPEGTHAIHIHETGDCSGDFSGAGGHLAGGAAHGVMDADGPHPGDMPNLVVGPDGAWKGEVFLAELSVEDMMMDADGSALIIHEGADDYTSQPSGSAGDRLACGVFEPAGN